MECLKYTYTDFFRLKKKSAYCGSSKLIISLDYDPVGNRTYQNANSTETYYTYDAANQLTLAHELGTGHSYYSYDASGNLTTIAAPGGAT